MTTPLQLSNPNHQDDPAVDLAASVFKALGDPVRLRLYLQIASRSEPICVCDLDDVGVSQPTVSHHLRKLREAGLIDHQRRGTWVYYRPLTEAARAARDLLPPKVPC